MIDVNQNQIIFANLVEENKISSDIIDNFQTEINWFLNNHFSCDLKTSLKNCQQKNIGYEACLSYENGRFYQKLIPCAHLAKQQEQKKYLDRFLFVDFDPLNLNSFLFLNNLNDQYKFFIQDEKVAWSKIQAYISDKKEFIVKKNVVTNFVDGLKSKNPFPGTYLVGTLGVGKTNLLKFLTVLAANKFEKTVAFTSVTNLISKLKESFNSEKNNTNQIFTKLMSADLVVLDDIGAEQPTNWVRDEVLFTILNYRMENKKLTYFTSNLTIEELQKNYFQLAERDPNKKIKTNRLLERIKALATELLLTGTDHRY